TAWIVNLRGSHESPQLMSVGAWNCARGLISHVFAWTWPNALLAESSQALTFHRKILPSNPALPSFPAFGSDTRTRAAKPHTPPVACRSPRGAALDEESRCYSKGCRACW